MRNRRAKEFATILAEPRDLLTPSEVRAFSSDLRRLATHHQVFVILARLWTDVAQNYQSSKRSFVAG